jgi:hypothetical protein
MSLKLTLAKIRTVWVWLRPILNGKTLDILFVMLPIARDAILEQVGKPIDNPTKKVEAMSIITDLLKRVGYKPSDLSKHVIELGFNIAFEKLRGESKV